MPSRPQLLSRLTDLRPAHQIPPNHPERRLHWQPPVSDPLIMRLSSATTCSAMATQLPKKLHQLRLLVQARMRTTSSPQPRAVLAQLLRPVVPEEDAGVGDAGAEPQQPLPQPKTHLRPLLQGRPPQGSPSSPETTRIPTPVGSVPAPPLRQACASV